MEKNLNKVITLLLLSLIVSFAGCGRTASVDEDTTAESTEVTIEDMDTGTEESAAEEESTHEKETETEIQSTEEESSEVETTVTEKEETSPTESTSLTEEAKSVETTAAQKEETTVAPKTETTTAPKEETVAPHTHTYDGGVVTVNASCVNSGTKIFTCTGCGNTYEEAIPLISHDFSVPVTQIVHHEELGHVEGGGKVKVVTILCNGCKQKFDWEGFQAHQLEPGGRFYEDENGVLRQEGCSGSSYQIYEKYEQQPGTWIVDREAYDSEEIVNWQCSRCGSYQN